MGIENSAAVGAKMKLATIATIIGIATGGGAITAGGWQGYELVTEVAANTDYRRIQEFEKLSMIRKRRRLSQVEWLKWCAAGKALGVFEACPAR